MFAIKNKFKMSEFKKKAQETLDEIFNMIEFRFKDYEVDFEDENLRVESLKNGNTYIVSIHTPTSQIWLSSPISGAHHFVSCDTDNFEWISTRNKEIKLFDLIKAELSN